MQELRVNHHSQDDPRCPFKYAKKWRLWPQTFFFLWGGVAQHRGRGRVLEDPTLSHTAVQVLWLCREAEAAAKLAQRRAEELERQVKVLSAELQ